MAKQNARPDAPIWVRPAPGSRRPKLSREQIAQAALAIADSEGFAEVSMRRVAAELGVGTMTLYYYVKTKDELVALMDDALAGEAVLPADQLPSGWRAGLTAIARSSRDVFMRHAWALYSLRGARVGPNGLRHMEQSLTAVSDTPRDVQGKFGLLSIVDDYVFGHVLRSSEAWAHPMDHKTLVRIKNFFEAQLATGQYPQLAGALGGGDMLGVFAKIAQWMSGDARFESGLTALLDGMERQMFAGPPAAPPARAPPPSAVPAPTATHAARPARGGRRARAPEAAAGPSAEHARPRRGWSARGGGRARR